MLQETLVEKYCVLAITSNAIINGFLNERKHQVIFTTSFQDLINDLMLNYDKYFEN